MKIFAKSVPVLAVFILAPLMSGSPAMGASANSKTFKGVGASCVDARKMARRAARKWRSAHCKEGHVSTFESAAGQGASTPADVECDKGADGKYTIVRKVRCTKGQDASLGVTSDKAASPGQPAGSN